jgi:ADP-ribose pyrophosphatase YjhB (NUDIX family)
MSRRYPDHPLLGIGALIFEDDEISDFRAATLSKNIYEEPPTPRQGRPSGQPQDVSPGVASTGFIARGSDDPPEHAPRILMVERAGNPLKGYWSLPGGLVETGESLETAVKREILEETGLQVEPLKMFELFERIMRDAEGKAEYHYVLLDYLCKVVGGTLNAGDDVSRAEWVRREDLPSLLITEGTLDVIERAYRARRSCT